MRAVAVLVLVVVSAGVTVGGGGAAPGAVEIRSCAPLSTTIQIQLVGDKDGVSFGRLREIPIPAHTAAVVVWGFGGSASAGGTDVPAWIAGSRSALAPRCTRVRAVPKAPSMRNLAAAVRVRDGLFTGRKFACVRSGRYLVEVRDVPGGNRLVVRMQRGGEVLAVGETQRGSAWLRGSKRCVSTER